MTEHPHNPQVDVIILSLDRVDDTLVAIRSALGQEGVTKKVWVVDQGSSAETVQTLKDFVAANPEVGLELLEENLGVPGGRNHASRLGNAPIIVSLDNDGLFADEHVLSRAAHYLEANPDLGAVGFRVLNYYTGTDDANWRYPAALKRIREQEFMTTRFPGGAHALRRAAFEAAGMYDASLFFNWEEVDLCYRMINLGYTVKYVPTIAILHKETPGHRVNWGGSRYYYFVRNALFVRAKFGVAWPKRAGFALAYLAKGLYNRVPSQALRATIDAARMSRDFARLRDHKDLYALTENARRYIFDNDLRHRGSVWQRLRKEVFVRLPGHAPSQ